MNKMKEEKKEEVKNQRYLAEQDLIDYVNVRNRLTRDQTEMDMEIAEIRSRYKDRIEANQRRFDFLRDQLEHFAVTNRKRYFSGAKKSLDMLNGTIGFRLGNPKLKSAKGYTWKSILECVKDKMTDYVRCKEEVAKDKIIADRGNDGMDDLMRICGIEMVQEENFFIDLKEDEAK